MGLPAEGAGTSAKTADVACRCPTCGNIITADIEWFPAERRVVTRFGFTILRGSEIFSIFNLLFERRGQLGLTRQRMIDILFADDAGGGVMPDTLSQAIRRLRKQVAAIGVEIVPGNLGGDGFQLAVTSPSSAADAIARRAKIYDPSKPSASSGNKPLTRRRVLWANKGVPECPTSSSPRRSSRLSLLSGRW